MLRERKHLELNDKWENKIVGVRLSDTTRTAAELLRLVRQLQ